MYLGREASKLWKRICTETSIEINLLAENWYYILGGLIFQYIHGVAARGVHFIHRPGPTLQDAGFFFLPELGKDKAYMSETVFTIIFLSFILWTFHPIIMKSKKIYTVLMWCRVLAFLVGSKLARLPRPDNILEVLLIKFPQGALYGCGDLIFSSHMIFSLTFVRTFNKYGTNKLIKNLAWSLVVIQSFLIVASRKHYTVDVVVAWYTVNLVIFFVDNKLPELPDRSSGGATQLLPLSKDNSRTKEEGHKLMNGNSAENSEWKPRTLMSGKSMEEGYETNDNV